MISIPGKQTQAAGQADNKNEQEARLQFNGTRLQQMTPKILIAGWNQAGGRVHGPDEKWKGQGRNDDTTDFWQADPSATGKTCDTTELHHGWIGMRIVDAESPGVNRVHGEIGAGKVKGQAP